MTLGTLKCTTIEDDASPANSVTVATLTSLSADKANLASPTFTGTVTMPAALSFTQNTSDITIPDNQAMALEVKEGDNVYVTFDTTNDGEQIEVDKAVVASENVTIDNEKALRFSEADGNGTDFIALKAPADLSNTTTTYTLPSAPTQANRVLSSTTGGVMSWVENPDTDTVFDVGAVHTFTRTQSVTPDDGTSDTTLDMSLSNFIQLGNTNISGDPTNLVVGTSGLFHCASAAPSGFHNDFKFPGGEYTAPTEFPAVAPWYIAADNTILVGSWTENITRS